MGVPPPTEGRAERATAKAWTHKGLTTHKGQPMGCRGSWSPRDELHTVTRDAEHLQAPLQRGEDTAANTTLMMDCKHKDM